MPVLTKSQINRMPKAQRQRREADIVYKACYHEAQRQGLWHKHASAQSVNFKAQVLPKLAVPIIDKYKSLGKVSPDFTLEVFSAHVNGETVAQDRPTTMPQILTKAVSQPVKAVRSVYQAPITPKTDSIDSQAEYVDSLKAQIAQSETDLASLKAQLETAEGNLQAAIDGLASRYRRPTMLVETESGVQALPGLELPNDQPVKRSKRSTKRRKA